MAQNERKIHWWTYVSRILAIIGGIWMCTQLYNYFSEKGTKLSVNLYKEDYILPVEINSVFFDHTDNEVFLKLLKKGIDSLGNLENLRPGITGYLYNSVNNSINNYNYIEHPRKHVFYSKTKAVIENKSETQLKGVVCITNSDESYYQYTINGALHYGYATGTVELGTMLPLEKLELNIWSNFSQKCDFVYENGTASVHEGKVLYGFWAGVGSFFSSGFGIPFLIFTLSLFMLTLSSPIIDLIQRREIMKNLEKHIDKTKEKETKENEIKDTENVK